MRNFENLCMKCMNDKGNLKKCPFCGYIDNYSDSTDNKKLLILQDKYVLGNKIFKNAESICYIGYDIKNNSRVNIREFFPAEICKRGNNGQSLLIKESCEKKYERLEISFLDYFRSLARVRDIDAITSVYDIFLDYGTAYIVSESIDGITLLDFIKKNKKPLDWETARILFMPVISALSRLSQAGILHLAINPKSLIIAKNGRMYISNFSPRESRQIGTFLDFEFYKGFTAPEQYIKNFNLTAAADIYGLASTLFFALVGFEPKDALTRESDDRLLIPVKLLKNIPPYVVSAISNAMRINIKARTQDFATLRDELTETSAKHFKENEYVYHKSNFKRIKKRNLIWIISATFVTLILFCIGVIFYLKLNNEGHKNNINDNDNILLQDSTELKENIVVPNFIGQSFDDLQKNSSGEDYIILLAEEVFDENVDAGKILSQTPEPQASVKKGSNIIVTVSKGPKFRPLPDIDGLPLSQAAAALTKEGFVPIKESQYSNNVQEGNVIGYKNYSKGSKFEYGSQITILVSKGKR